MSNNTVQATAIALPNTDLEALTVVEAAPMCEACDLRKIQDNADDEAKAILLRAAAPVLAAFVAGSVSSERGCDAALFLAASISIRRRSWRAGSSGDDMVIVPFNIGQIFGGLWESSGRQG